MVAISPPKARHWMANRRNASAAGNFQDSSIMHTSRFLRAISAIMSRGPSGELRFPRSLLLQLQCAWPARRTPACVSSVRKPAWWKSAQKDEPPALWKCRKNKGLRFGRVRCGPAAAVATPSTRLT